MKFKVLYIGEIVGKSGLFAVKKLLPEIRKTFEPDFVIAQADSVTNGAGIGKNHSIYIKKLGIDVITTGECVYYKKDMVEHISKSPYILRAANLPTGVPGRGFKIYEVAGVKIAVMCFMGQAGYTRIHAGNPFTYLSELAERLGKEANIVIADFHATTTAEKYTMFRMMDGSIGAIIGSHAKALTADEQIGDHGTAFICDAGRTGALRSVGGLDAKVRIQEYLSGIPEWSKESWDTLEMQGVLMDFDPATGKALEIRRLRIACTEANDAGNGNGNEEEREETPCQVGND